MNTEVLSLVITGATKIVGQVIRGRSIKTESYRPQAPVRTVTIARTTTESPLKPSTAETVEMLERRLNESLVALQPDLLDGARINSKPCDCLAKHTDEMLAAVRELQSMASKPVYAQIRQWAEAHNWDASEVARHPPQFFIDMVPQLRMLRKELNGSEPKVEQQSSNPAVQEITSLSKKVSSGEITREQAVGRIKELASATGHQ